MSRKLLLVLIGLGVAIAVAAGIYFVAKGIHSATLPTTSATSTNPFGQTGLQGGVNSTGSNGNPVSIRTRGGQVLSVPDFTSGHPSINEQSGTYYYVTQDENGNQEASDFSIVYGGDSSVSIGLLAEPLGAARAHAEAKLRQLIPATNDQLCSLDVSVMVPPSVSDNYAGDDLGLSFCPNAIVLP